MQENFQDAEIGVAQFCALDAPGRVGEQRLKGFHENEPDMDAGGILLLERRLAFHRNSCLTAIILMSIYFKSTKQS